MKLILKIILAVLILILFGVAGEMDYQDYAAHHQPTTQY